MSRKAEMFSLLQDVIIAIIVVVIVLGSLWAYGGRWPPMVVVESESMQHSHDESSVGVIDTGDLTLVRTLERSGGVTTWVEGRKTGYERYDDFGDVIVYHKNGLRETTPIIHRALVRVVWNETGSGYDVPSLGVLHCTTFFKIEGLTSYHNGYRETIDLQVNVQTIINNFATNPSVDPHDGIITKGDHNRDVDQATLPAWNGAGGRPPGISNLVEPVKDGWIVGVARGEIPWFGLIKLWAKGQTKDNPAPATSGYNLMISVALLLVGPFLAESAVIEYRKMRPREEDRKRGKRRRGKEGGDELRGPFVWVYRTIRNALTGKVD
jgi:signal peptidase